MNILGIIPARYASTRLEGKPLKDIGGQTMIERVYRKCRQALDTVVVATDDQRIYDAVKQFGGEVIMTGAHHTTGTNRCLEALERYTAGTGYAPDIVINIQGDEPLLAPQQIRAIADCFQDKDVELASLALPVKPEEEIRDNEGVYVVLDINGDALYFSRSAIPFYRDLPRREWAAQHTYYKHIGMYAYTPKALKKFAKLAQTGLEKAESLEQNRWLENGLKIRMGITSYPTIAVDTPEDLERVRRIIREQGER